MRFCWSTRYNTWFECLSKTQCIILLAALDIDFHLSPNFVFNPTQATRKFTVWLNPLVGSVRTTTRAVTYNQRRMPSIVRYCGYRTAHEGALGWRHTPLLWPLLSALRSISVSHRRVLVRVITLRCALGGSTEIQVSVSECSETDEYTSQALNT